MAAETGEHPCIWTWVWMLIQQHAFFFSTFFDWALCQYIGCRVDQRSFSLFLASASAWIRKQKLSV